MSRTVIEVRDLGKQYRIRHRRGPYRTLRESIMGLISRGREESAAKGHPTTKSRKGNQFWALKDLSFDVNEGEVLGIIGHNGAGKTTLLRLLSRITEPTTGGFRIRGRVGSLLEVGTGFHPELTGRENTYLSGAILGMPSREITAKFDEIVAFAGVEPFIDMPVKHYSSGMYLRLAFAVAAHLEPDVLLVDEVLAVGDAAFQNKCLGKMQDVAGTGRTVVFVSHNMAAVTHMCHRVIWVNHGRLCRDGAAADVVAEYLDGVGAHSEADLAIRQDRRGNGKFRFTRANIANAVDRSSSVVVSGGAVTFEFDFAVNPGISVGTLIVKVSIRDRDGKVLFILGNVLSGDSLHAHDSPGVLLCTIDKLPLNSGTYVIDLVAKLERDLADEVNGALQFTVNAADVFGSGNVPQTTKHGPIFVDHSWKMKQPECNVSITTPSSAVNKSN